MQNSWESRIPNSAGPVPVNIAILLGKLLIPKCTVIKWNYQNEQYDLKTNVYTLVTTRPNYSKQFHVNGKRDPIIRDIIMMTFNQNKFNKVILRVFQQSRRSQKAPGKKHMNYKPG